MSNNKKPLFLMKSHMTKADIIQHEKSSLKLGDSEFKMPISLRKNPVAKKTWNEIIKNYKQFNVKEVTTSDSRIIEQFCLTYSTLSDLESLSKSTSDVIEKLKIETRIERKQDLLIKLSDRLFLNPASKIKVLSSEKTNAETSNLSREQLFNKIYSASKQG